MRAWVTLCGVAFTLVLGIGWGGLVIRLGLEGERAMARSDVEFNRGRLRESLLYARRAAVLRAPGLAHVRRADARLEAIASGAESARMRELAILAWQAIRSAESQRQWGIERPSDRARQADRRLAALLADDGRHVSLLEQQQSARQVEADYRSIAGPLRFRRIGQLLALGIGGVGALGCLVGFGRGSQGRLWRFGGAGLLGIGAIAWAILLLLA